MKTFLNKNIKNLFAVLSMVAFTTILCSCNFESEYTIPDTPVIDIDETVTPINELYKNLDFTAIAAHRCYFRNFPENSLGAIQDGLDLGIEFLEADTQTTADGVVILFHDTTLDRTTNGSGLIANINFGNLNNFKLTNNRNGAVLTDESIPTLEQALLKIKGKSIYMHLEVKDKNFSEVVKVIKSTGTENQVVVFADTRNDYNTIDTFAGIFIDPVCRTSDDFDFYLGRSNTALLNLAGSQFNAANTLAAKNNNKLTWRGITNKPEDLELRDSSNSNPTLDALVQVNPSIIHTDYADLLIPYLISKNKR